MRQILVLAIALLPSVAAAEDFQVGVWNIEKLSTRAKRGFPELRGDDQYDPRTGTDLKKVAEYIVDTLKVDKLIVTEIDDDGPDRNELRPRSAQLTSIVDELGRVEVFPRTVRR
jgi:hypothetical protein